MTILDRIGSQRIRSEAGQIADDLAKRLPDLDRTRDQATSAVQDAAGQARHQLDRAASIARGFRDDIAHAADGMASDTSVDEIGQRIRAVASPAGVRALVARLEKELPDIDRDRYRRAYTRGRAQGRTTYLVVGLVAGVCAGAVAAILLDPKHGKERRETIVRRARGLAEGAGKAVGGTAQVAPEQAHDLAPEQGAIEPAEPGEPRRPLVPVFANDPVTDPSADEAIATRALAAEGLALEAAGDHGTLPSNHG